MKPIAVVARATHLALHKGPLLKHGVPLFTAANGSSRYSPLVKIMSLLCRYFAVYLGSIREYVWVLLKGDIMVTKFQKTSLQLSPTVLEAMDSWEGLTRSEALRLAVERGQYFSTLCFKKDNVVGILNNAESLSVLRAALEDFEYDDYRVIVRSLPEIVTGFLTERGGSFSAFVTDSLEELEPLERVAILDYVVAKRHRLASPSPHPTHAHKEKGRDEQKK